MNTVEFARRRLLQGNFLLADELSQEQYELVTNPETKPAKILALYDELTGAHLNGKVVNPLDEGPFFCLDEGEVGIVDDEASFDGEDGSELATQYVQT